MNTNQNNASLELAKRLSETVNAAWESGEPFSISSTCTNHKAIYPRQAYPTHGGGFERSFMVFLDKDGEVERFLKINESYGRAVRIMYYQVIKRFFRMLLP